MRLTDAELEAVWQAVQRAVNEIGEIPFHLRVHLQYPNLANAHRKITKELQRRGLWED